MSSLGMSVHDDELPGGALSPSEQARARRTLFGISAVFVGVALMGFAGDRPLGWLWALVVIIGAVMGSSRPQGTGRTFTPHNVRRIARLAAVPEVGAIVVVYVCLIVGIIGAVVLVTTTI